MIKNFIKNNFKYLLIILSIALIAGLGSVFVNLGMNWFNKLIKPSQWIPNFVIPIAWTIIYLSFIVILILILKNNTFNKITISLLTINGILNVLWCLIFFTLQQTLLGNIIIILNSFFATLLLINLLKYNKWYINILWIYPIWIFLATSFNLALWILN